MGEVLEYVFFDQSLAHRFAQFCKSVGVESSIEQSLTHTEDDSFTIMVADNLPEAVQAQLEEQYSDMLFGEQAAQIEGNSEAGALADSCGVQIQLQSGDFTNIAIEPEIMNKILSVLTTAELQAFLAQVAEDIENPKSGPICCRVKL